MRKVSSIGAAVLLTVAGTGVAVIGAAAPASATCSHYHTNIDNKYGQLFNGSNINIRTGPHTSCGSLGYGQLSHSVDFHCFTSGDRVSANGHTTYTWTYLKDTTTGVSGWVADALLDGLGSGIAC
ncbi:MULTISPECIES: hypothetical protein [Micromonospora]|uniref:Bacterial SH3 domain n=1 Tax=Micromonospora solifontis TaxID=2487138 RepID=A0ABX9WL86_9ACTN|nr:MULTISPECIES: hypothetical protein [Micromonospora]NES14879.1 hypothetical protein [Micromonospora sp. PPF5-17B]NES35198.1 hypothetical protein [Micromonospora solifontis]NES55193.1 hypothetical protein [Micromonospora sp. PPF5-6]RNM01177.1 hypothetical protein EFE23_03315 [Micromonospora solifontis]